MPDNNLSAPAEPVVTTPPSEDQLAEDLANLLEPAETDQPGADEDKAASAEPEDDPLGLDAPAEDEDENDADNPDGPDAAEIKGGRFAPDSAKVKLEDGTTISIAELKRNNLYHAGFTQKTQALAKDREAFDAERRQVAEYAQTLDQSREYLAWYAEQYLPKQPQQFQGDPSQDPMGYLKWQQDRDNWLAHVQAYQTFQQQRQQDTERQSGETKKQHEERMRQQAGALVEAFPVLKDKAKGPQFWNALLEGAEQHYGITADEVNATLDPRLIKALRDALGYRRIQSRAGQVQQQITQKPVKPGARRPPQAAEVRGRKERTERLRQSGSIDDAAAAIADLL